MQFKFTDVLGNLKEHFRFFMVLQERVGNFMLDNAERKTNWLKNFFIEINNEMQQGSSMPARAIYSI